MTRVRITRYTTERSHAWVTFEVLETGLPGSCLIQWDGDTLTRELIKSNIASALAQLKGTNAAQDLLAELNGQELDIEA